MYSNLEEYYFGLIQLNPYIYQKDTSRRMLGSINYDPFDEKDILTGAILGEITLLKRKGNIFFDEYYSRYQNELKYELGKTNPYGIHLTYIKPVKDYVTKDPIIIEEKEIENPLLMTKIWENFDYYIKYSKTTRKTTLVLLNDSILEKFREDYYEETFRKKEYQKK